MPSLHMRTELNVRSSYLSSKHSTLKANSSAPVLLVFAQTKCIAPNSQPSAQILTEHCGKDKTKQRKSKGQLSKTSGRRLCYASRHQGTLGTLFLEGHFSAWETWEWGIQILQHTPMKPSILYHAAITSAPVLLLGNRHQYMLDLQLWNIQTGKRHTWLAGATELKEFTFLISEMMRIGKRMVSDRTAEQSTGPRWECLFGLWVSFQFVLPHDLGWLPHPLHSPWAWQGNLEGTKPSLSFIG